MKIKLIQLSLITSLALSLNASTIEPITNWSKYPLPQEVVSKSKGGQLSDKEAMKDGVGSILVKGINGNSITLNNEQYNQLLLLNKDKLTNTVGLKELIANGDIVVDSSTLNSINGNGLSNPTGLPANGTSCDDNNTNTENDVYDSNGVCIGTPIVLSCANARFETINPGDASKNTGKNGFIPSFISLNHPIELSYTALFDNIYGTGYQAPSASYWYYVDSSLIMKFDKPFRIWRAGVVTWAAHNKKLSITRLDDNLDFSNKHLSLTTSTNWELFTECLEPGTYNFGYTANYRIDREWFVEAGVK